MWIVWFCQVYLVRYEKENRNVVIKKMKGESIGRSKILISQQESGNLNTVKGHRNVSDFLRFCQDSYAIMMEYSYFDLSPF